MYSRKSLNFDYNYLNLLEKAGVADYSYSTDGVKLSVRDDSGNGFTYLGSLILSANSTEFQFSDGIITKTTGGYDVTYHLRDHLGSVRAVVNKDGDILQQSDYYPFGKKQERADYVNNSNRFLFNGKESQTTGNLGLLDYGARMYDADLGRMNTLDRFPEKAVNLSPYQYAGNDPILNIDINGDSINVSHISVEAMLKVVWDLNQITGLNVSISGGMLHAEKNDNAEGFSQTAQDMLLSAINNTQEDVIVVEKAGGSKGGGVHVILDMGQIESFIRGTSSDLDSKTLGYGMSFLHELGHTNLGGSRRDYYNDPSEKYDINKTGPNVDFMNKIRKELGPKYGQRISYPESTDGYLPFNLKALRDIKQGKTPTSSYIKTR